ncbi:bifunctional (p)ppGpp synthetase/guanosine-3',5'-bis(diphosphate) 3'-pyrophosphohydrolase [Marispirochaeta aestuarii]|uniref:RelA/SpoT family protein n=1 Tax=Marispirochaeta aestuarii TaxID=1963862 RepID=UPI0029C7DD1E|nr:bifunctional (p)ppGpp synthetase/guanosine-3',5'-bis(diphosphate) 3'-pyrophosphohydrolase [Marispirochaeta aestuarii]
MQTRIEQFEKQLTRYTPEERNKIMEALLWGEELHREQKRASGEPFYIHPMKVAEILVQLEMDYETIIAALLHDVLEDTEGTKKEMQRRFGKEIVALVNGVTKISILRAKSKSVQGAETIRKMLFAMTKDIRVILIKLADKLHNMSTLEYLPEEKRKRIAQECLDIYAPLADRLGISWVKIELEDLALKNLHPLVYTQIKEAMTEKKRKRADYLKKVERTIQQEAHKEGITIEVQSRAKHFFSIYQKMKRRQKGFSEIHDLLGLRILCNTTGECYTLLGLVHKLWPPIEGRFKDYIAMPKSNQYQSLHTTVMCWEGKQLEIQIRTHQMHATAEMGIAAHWSYKRRQGKDRTRSEDLAIINKLKSLNGRGYSSSEFLAEIKSELLKDTIYVFTPRGDIIELPKGATALDFAYHIHTEVGNHCLGAKADGSIISLSTELKNTQVVDIITSNSAHPHVNWLKFVKTARARGKIRHWLNQHDDSLIIDKNIIAKKRQEAQPPQGEEVPQSPPEAGEIIKQIVDRAKVAFKIGGEKNMMITMAKCCAPATGDDIIGYISRGRGIIVHRRDCPNLAHINEFEERSVEVQWEAATPRATRRFQITARMTSDLFSEIEGAIRKYRGHLIEGKLEENDRGNLTGFFTMELDRKEDFKTVLKSIRTIPSVMSIQ